MILTYRYRVKNLYGELNRQARAINFVWNYCNDRQKDALRWNKNWPTAFDLINLTSGSSKELAVLANSIGSVCQQYVQSRSQKKLPFLRYRGKRSLGWIPFRGRDIGAVADGFRFFSKTYRVFMSRAIPVGSKMVDGGSFSCDASGCWYINLVMEIPDVGQRAIDSVVGVDLGLKEFAVLSTGEIVSNQHHFAALETKLATAQRARKKRQAARVHARIANRRRDALHKISTRLVKEFDYIAVGNVSAARLAKTNMAKSVNDAGWSSFRNMLRYKAIAHGDTFEEVNESGSTRVCSGCGSASGPKGIADLGIRTWTCRECGCIHDRDINSAINILFRSGHRSPVEGIAA